MPINLELKPKKIKSGELDYRIAMVKMGKYDDHSIAISLVNPKRGVKYYFDSMQAGGGRSYKEWHQRNIIRRSEKTNFINAEVRSKINKDMLGVRYKPIKLTYEDNANPIILSEDRWSSIKRYLSTFVVYYPLYREWIYERFDNPVGLLESIYDSQDEEFNAIVSHRQDAIINAIKQRDKLQKILNEKIKNTVCNICANNFGMVRDVHLGTLKRAIERKVLSIESIEDKDLDSEKICDVLKKDPSCLRNTIKSSMSTVVEELSEGEEEQPIVDEVEEEKRFEHSKVAYEEIKKTTNDNQDLFDQLAQLLYERHRMIRKVSYFTPTETTYDNWIDSINDEITVLQQAIRVIEESAQSVLVSSDERNVDLDRQELISRLPEDGLELFREV